MEQEQTQQKLGKYTLVRHLATGGMAEIWLAEQEGPGGFNKQLVIKRILQHLARDGQFTQMFLDADVYGPNVPLMLGVKAAEPQVIQETVNGETVKRILPFEAHGMQMISMGLLVAEDQAVIWRGPMLHGSITSFLRDTDWGPLDYLVIDMPPGTGDAQLTLSQRAKLAGAVIVSTPQDLALIDARKGLNMFRKVNVPLLGIIENMSHFLCTDCGARHDIFGHGGAAAEAEKLGVPFLGEVPLEMAIRTTSDDGNPIVASQPDSQHAAHYQQIASALLAQLDTAQPKAAPKIVME